MYSVHHWEKATATHSSTLAWKIPWTEEPGRLQSIGSLSDTAMYNGFNISHVLLDLLLIFKHVSYGIITIYYIFINILLYYFI